MACTRRYLALLLGICIHVEIHLVIMDLTFDILCILRGTTGVLFILLLLVYVMHHVLVCNHTAPFITIPCPYCRNVSLSLTEYKYSQQSKSLHHHQSEICNLQKLSLTRSKLYSTDSDSLSVQYIYTFSMETMPLWRQRYVWDHKTVPNTFRAPVQ